MLSVTFHTSNFKSLYGKFSEYEWQKSKAVDEHDVSSQGINFAKEVLAVRDVFILYVVVVVLYHVRCRCNYVSPSCCSTVRKSW